MTLKICWKIIFKLIAFQYLLHTITIPSARCYAVSALHYFCTEIDDPDTSGL